jgi:uncharacterized protein
MTLITRTPRFVFSSTIASHWCPDQPEFSHAASAFMAALPELEPYFIHNVREALPLLRDAALREQAEAFISQEARHAQQHRRFNALLAERYPDLPRFERALRARLDASKREHSLAFRLAYTSGYEAITYHLVCFMMAERALWLRDADPNVLALLSWHAAEEVEHKSVAYDLLRAVAPGYLLRVRGLVSAFVNTVRDIRSMTRYMLEVDGLYSEPSSRRRLRGVRLALAGGLIPRFMAYLKPRYLPGEEADPPLMVEWLARHARGDALTSLTSAELDAMDGAGQARVRVASNENSANLGR